MRELRIEVLGGTVLRLVGPAGEVLGRRDLAMGEIDALVDEVTSDYETHTAHLRTIGNRLYAWLDGSGQGWLTKAREAPRGEVLCIRLDVGHRLRHLPWELAAVEGVYLVADGANPFCPLREVDKRGSGYQVANRPLRALFMASSPEGVSPLLDFEAEEARILAAAGVGGVDLVVEERGSLDGLAEVLKRHGPGRFDVVHLSSHADVTPDLGPHLLLETDTGGLDRCSADRLIAAVEGHWPRVLFVSGPCTGQSPERGVEPSFAEQLVRAGAPCVVGWGQPVGDDAATAVAAALYARLGNAEDPATAVARARREALEKGFGDWHLLRVYVDGSELVPLVTPPATPGRPRIQLRPAHREFLDADQRSRVCAADRSVGRRRVLQRCLRSLATLDQSASDYAEGVVLHGMGGLGKSSLAARLCERLRTHQRLVWVGTFDDGELLRLMNAKLDADATKLLNQPDLPLRNRLRDVLLHLDATGAPPLLFVLDDFDPNVEGHDDGYPRLVGPGGSGLLTTATLDALDALTWAIRKTASPSRVIITCRYVIAGPPAPVRLAHVGLNVLAGGELAKKIALLPTLSPSSEIPVGIKTRAIEMAGGNPRLLELLDQALATEGVDFDGMVTAMESATRDFHARLLPETAPPLNSGLSEVLAEVTRRQNRAIEALACFDLAGYASALDALQELSPEAADALRGELPDLDVARTALGSRVVELWRLLDARSPVRLRAEAIDAVSTASSSPDDPAEDLSADSPAELLAQDAQGMPRRPEDRGDDLELAMHDLMEQLFEFDDPANGGWKLRRQRRGEQYGFDLSFQAPCRGNSALCLVECKNYTSTVGLDEVAAKVVQAQANWHETSIDHWILVSPHAEPDNRLDRMIERWNAERELPFSVQVWSPNSGVERLFLLSQTAYEAVYGRPPPEVDRAVIAEVRRDFSERLAPYLRIPRPFLEAARDPTRFLHNNEGGGRWPRQLGAHLQREGLTETRVPLAQPLLATVLDWIAAPPDEGDTSMLLLGDFGEGKSFFTFELCVAQASLFRSDPSNSPFPLRMVLKDFRHVAVPEQFVAGQLDRLGASMVDYHQMLRSAQVVVILDGIDEMSVRQDSKSVTENLEKLRDLLNFLGGIPVLMTSRPHFLASPSERERFFDRLRRPLVYRIAQPSRSQTLAHLERYADRTGNTDKLLRLRCLYDRNCSPSGLR